ncbi:MAG: (Fe-S)-binding protein, partial [Maritimibacter sp.]|nr:(Fe-S)-binding protein [Maritimibacter sp.]
GMSSSGHGPVELTGAAVRHTEGTSPMGNLSKALQARVKQAEALTDLEIELDKPDVDYLLLLSSHEIAAGPEMIESIAKIMNKAGKSWTISTEGFEATNVGIQLGNRDVAANLVSRIVNAAEKLRVKTVISPECGHAFTAVRWEGPNLIGRPYKFEVKHVIEVLDQFRAEGLLKTNGEKDHARITFHDPCQVARRGGVIKEPRNLLGMVADNFVETEDAGVMNWCCSGGGGVGANQRANDIQEKAFGRKKKQIQDVAPDKIVTM